MLSEGICIEVIGNYKERYPAKIYNFASDKDINIKFDDCPDVIVRVSTDIVHLYVDNVQKSSDVTVGSDVLVYQKVDNLTNMTSFNDVRLTHAWWPGKVGKLKGCFAVINFSYRENENNSDIIELNNIRPLPPSTPISREDVHSHEMVVPDDLCEFCENYDLRGDLVRWCGPSIVVNFDKNHKRLHIYSTQKEVVRRASLLDASFMRVLRQKKLIHIQKAELTKKLNDSIRNNYIEEFSVAEELMGLAIGSQGCNIKKAREIEGVINIDLDDRTHTFTVTAQNTEAGKMARAQLEYIKDIYYVPEDVVSKIIGRNGNQIQDIIDQSGVMRVRVAKQPHLENWADEENKHLLTDHVPFIFVGNRNSIRDARLLLEFSIDHHREMDRLQRERDEIHREIRNSKALNPNNSRHNSASEREEDQSQYHVSHQQLHPPRPQPHYNTGRGRGNRTRGNYKSVGQSGAGMVSHSDAERNDNGNPYNSYVDDGMGGNRIRHGHRNGSYRRMPTNSYRQGSLPPGNMSNGSHPNGNRRYFGHQQYEEENTTDDYQSAAHEAQENGNGVRSNKNRNISGNSKFRGNGRGSMRGSKSNNNRSNQKQIKHLNNGTNVTASTENASNNNEDTVNIMSTNSNTEEIDQQQKEELVQQSDA